MKKLIPSSIIAALTLVMAAPSADARHPYHGTHPSSHVYISGYRSCGSPVYQERYVRSYRRCGSPVWGYRVVGMPRHYHHAHGYHHPRRVVVCPPPAGYYHPRSRVVIHSSWRY